MIGYSLRCCLSIKLGGNRIQDKILLYNNPYMDINQSYVLSNSKIVCINYALVSDFLETFVYSTHKSNAIRDPKKYTNFTIIIIIITFILQKQHKS